MIPPNIDSVNSILVVDDDPQICRLLSAILEECGYFCETAENVPSARQVLQGVAVDLVLTDRDMPGESGIDLIRYIKDHHPHTGVIMVTVIDDPQQARDVLALGIYGYITKPFTHNQVLIAVENALRHRRLDLHNQYNTIILAQEVARQTETLNEQVRFLQTLIDAIPASVYYKDAHGRYMGCNRAFEELIGQPRQAIVGKTAADLYAPRLADVLRENDQQLFQTSGTQRYETTILLPDGSQQIGMLHNATFTDSSGRIAGLVGVRLDITELKATEQSLRLSEEKLRFITNNLHVGAVMINPQMELVQINRQMRRWFPDIVGESGRWFEEEFVRKQWLPDEDSPIQEMFDTGRAKEATVPLATAEGERIFKVIFSPIYDESEQMTHTAIGLFEDVTDSLLAERELRQAQKLEAIGQLAAGIAHEINTPIQYVGDNVRFIDEAFSELASLYTTLKDRLPMLAQGVDVSAFVREIEKISEQADLDFLLEEMPGTVEQTIEGVNRVATIVRAMREFSHPGSEEKVQTDINRALASTITVSRNEWKYVADVETDLAEDFPLLLCLPGELNQVFLNILVNAAHAIAETSENGKKGKGLIQVATCSDSDWMEIRISDTGGGIPESIQGRIFDPFFTTKKVGKGTGQGLAIARSVVVDKHQGSLQFTTEAGKGTTFIIRLPLL